MKILDTEKIKEIIEYSGEYKTRSYSGRFMYGKNCLGVVVENIGDFLGDFFQNFHDLYFSDDMVDISEMREYDDAFTEMCDLLRQYESDNMGRDSQIVYWKCLKVENTPEPNEDE